MAKYHIGKNGPAICKAEKRACRYGETDHYSTIGQAQKVYEQHLQKNYHNNIFQTLNKNTISKSTEYINKINNILNKNELSNDDLQEIGKIFNSEVVNRLGYDPDLIDNLSSQQLKNIAVVNFDVMNEIAPSNNCISEINLLGSNSNAKSSLMKGTMFFPDGVKMLTDNPNMKICVKKANNNNLYAGRVIEGNVINTLVKSEPLPYNVKIAESYGLKKDQYFLNSMIYDDTIGVISIYKDSSGHYSQRWLQMKNYSPKNTKFQTYRKVGHDDGVQFVKVLTSFGKEEVLEVVPYEILDRKKVHGFNIEIPESAYERLSKEDINSFDRRSFVENGCEWDCTIAHEYSHIVQKCQPSELRKLEIEMYDSLADEKIRKRTVMNLDCAEGFPNSYMGEVGKNELFTRSVECFYFPHVFEGLYGLKRGVNADRVKNWIPAHLIALDHFAKEKRS